MNFESYTERSRGFIESAQGRALRAGHQRFVPEHLLKELLEDKEGLAANLMRAAAARPEDALQAADAALGCLATPPNPKGNTGPLNGLGLDGHIVEGEELPVVGDVVLGPKTPQQGDGLIDSATALFLLGSQCLVLPRVILTQAHGGENASAG